MRQNPKLNHKLYFKEGIDYSGYHQSDKDLIFVCHCNHV